MKNLDCSHVFLTCDVANMQWHDFYKHMFDFSTFCEAIDTKKERLTHRFLQKNSHIAVEYLDRRFQLFFKQIIKKKFSVVDYWYRFEWQTRDSDHIYEFIWLENAFSFECLDEFLVFWSSQATIINSTKEISFVFFYSCSRSFSQQNNILRESRSYWIEFKNIRSARRHTA